MWIGLGLLSCVFLGVYDLCKKHALNGNAVLPVLFGSNLVALTMMLPILFGWLASFGLVVDPLAPAGHLFLMGKALIVSTSWTLAYFALKHLPISIVSPIRASGPVWTLLGAILLFHEQPAPLQWAGMGLIFISYFAFSFVGREEGIHFHRSKWVLFIFLATLIGTCSTLYDKWLIQRQGYTPLQVQAWFSVYTALIFGLLLTLLWWPKRRACTAFQWRWSIIGIGVLLVLADFTYFQAVSDSDALIVILSVLRRCSVLVSFFMGAFLFKEVNKRKKAWILLGILLGVLLIVLAG